MLPHDMSLMLALAAQELRLSSSASVVETTNCARSEGGGMALRKQRQNLCAGIHRGAEEKKRRTRNPHNSVGSERNHYMMGALLAFVGGQKRLSVVVGGGGPWETSAAH